MVARWCVQVGVGTGGIGISHRCIPQHFISIVADFGFGNAIVTTLPPLPVHIVSSAQKHLYDLQSSGICLQTHRLSQHAS